MVREYIQLMEGVLFIGASLLIYIWSKKEGTHGLIKRVSIFSILLGIYKLIEGFSNIYFPDTIAVFFIGKLLELSGLVIFMFGLMHYLGVKK